MDAENPEDQQAIKAVIEEAQRLRGWIANGYAQIEYLLGDLIVRSLSLDEYRHVASTLPHGAPDRIKRIRRLLKAEGPLSPFEEELQYVVDEFETKHEIRNLLVHGFCEFLYTKEGDCGLRFRKWHRVEGRQDARLERTFRLDNLETERSELTALASRAVGLFYRIHDRMGWVDE